MSASEPEALAVRGHGPLLQMSIEAGRSLPCRRANGFTLVEVLAALLVLALALVALQLQIGGQVDASAYLRDRSVARWVALNQLELLRLESRLRNSPLQEPRSGETAMAGRRWYWEARPEPLDADSLIVPLTLTVSAAPGGAPLATLGGVTDGYHSR